MAAENNDLNCLKTKRGRIALASVLAIGLLLVVILVPMTFSYVEYYEYGLVQRKTTGAVDTSKVYSRGRYALGPDYKFLKYQSDSHFDKLQELSVFSAGGSNESVGLEFKIDADFTFLLKRDSIGLVHQELASSYEDVIVSRSKDAIKNEAIFVTFSEYFQNRKEVERRFAEAVQKRWDADPPLHCTLDQFHLGRIRIPDSVASKQLESKVQNERNDMEAYLQQAQIEREVTAVEVNEIDLETENVLRSAEAEASLLRSKAATQADQIKKDAQLNGTKFIFDAVGIETEDHMTAFTYIDTLKKRANLALDVSYLDADSILKTKPL